MEWEKILWSMQMIKQIRCAIYTRKSSEEGLEQDFNSLDAQREACEAYIKSQKHEGWILIEKQYNDGGFSGGTMERPAFKELLKDIENDEVDIVVVYKVDRLTRSLMDFSKIIDVFDRHETSFVSITQQFNTTTSMGRLTLNILLSFAQFEREVTGERIRDKFAASRKKGMFLHGTAPIGYKKENGTLIEIPEQSALIKMIFEKYLELGATPKLYKYLIENNIKTLNGKDFSVGHLNKLLNNKVYIGKITHKNEEYEGLHKGIINEELFQKVQECIKSNKGERKFSTNNHPYALLSSKLFDDNGNYMSPTYSNNRHKKRYRYYVSQALIQHREQDTGSTNKIPAEEIENFVRQEIKELIMDKEKFQPYLSDYTLMQQNKILDYIGEIQINDQIIRLIVSKVIIYKDKVEIEINKNMLIKTLENLAYNKELPTKNLESEVIKIIKDVKIIATPRHGNKLIVGDEVEYNSMLINTVIKGFYLYKLWKERKLQPEQKTTYNYRLMNLRFLPPKIVEDILNGKQEPTLTVKKLHELARTA